jgi:hypothetical protein
MWPYFTVPLEGHIRQVNTNMLSVKRYWETVQLRRNKMSCRCKIRHVVALWVILDGKYIRTSLVVLKYNVSYWLFKDGGLVLCNKLFLLGFQAIYSQTCLMWNCLLFRCNWNVNKTTPKCSKRPLLSKINLIHRLTANDNFFWQFAKYCIKIKNQIFA